MNKEKIKYLALFIILMSLCGFSFFFNLDKLCSEMWDESRNGINALEMRYNHQFMVTHFNGEPDMWNTKPPLFIWMAALCMKLFGTTVFALRLPSALSALSIAIYCFWFSRKYLKSVLPGFFAGLVLATSIGFVDFHVARNGDFDAMLSMWIFFYSTQFFLYLESEQKKHLILAALFLAGAILTKGIAGCLFLPGIFFFAIINKNYRNIFKKREFYIITFSGLLLGISYYFIREIFNQGYIKSVIENEITGRYLQTNEGHEGDTWFYLRILNDFQFSIWLYWLPLAFLITIYTGEEWFKKLGLFLFISIICNLIVLTISQTKLKWYDAPLYPFMALLIGMAITQLYTGFKKLFHFQKSIVHIIFFILFSISIFAEPFKRLQQTSIFREREKEYNALLFGDFFENYYSLFPQQKSLKIISHGYNPHLLFYTKIYQHQGRNLTIINQDSEINTHDTVMLCDPNLWPNYNPNYVFDTLYQEGAYKFIITIAESIDLSDSIKIGEKKLFRCIGSIQNDAEWSRVIKEKSEKSKIDFKKQLMYDALWHLVSHKMISLELQDILKKKYNLLP